ncbi:MAG: DUF4249 domain-containing protein [Bacteroidetes bacterium]|nr:DUF4249 domain-containing protein [Bacteroidota bacterium]MDA1120475.1 DUF4249 domain-containing protein [Bacteroidota bacterium]
MSNKILTLILLLCTFSFLRCIDEFTPAISESDFDFLIVDGQITNAVGPYYVRLSRSTPINPTSKSPVPGANVQIEEEGTIYSLTDQGDGLYLTDGLQGKPSLRYRLLIELNGSQYESSWQTLRPSPVIDNIYYEVDIIGTEDPDFPVRGIQWFVESHGEASGARYYRYEWDETFQTQVKWATCCNYLGNDIIEVIFPPEDQHNTCWITNPSVSIDLFSTTSLSENIVSAHPLSFVKDGERLSVRYSLLVRQYALEEEEYQFWNALKETNVEGGNLFDKPPASVIGNIKNKSDPDMTVLGYFSANGVSEQRVYVANDELPEGFGTFIIPCQLDSILKGQSNYEEFIFSQIDGGKIFFDLIRTEGEDILGVTLADPICVDCVFRGGDAQKPDFWP